MSAEDRTVTDLETTAQALRLAEELEKCWALLPADGHKYPWTDLALADSDARLLVAAVRELARRAEYWQGIARETADNLHEAIARRDSRINALVEEQEAAEADRDRLQERITAHANDDPETTAALEDIARAAARRLATPDTPPVTHGRHCPCSACAREDWTRITGPCGMHGADCPAVYAPVATPDTPPGDA